MSHIPLGVYALAMLKLKVAAAFAAIALLLTGCSSEDLSPSNASVDVVVDVRTPGEYAAGHVAGAINIDVESGDFASAIGTLDKSKTYLVYCHSGRRSGIAAEQMRSAGLNVLDGGAIDAMVSRGWSLGA
ncbi:MAG: hypothetical protein RL441_1497 [Actinomycetota bacterium]